MYSKTPIYQAFRGKGFRPGVLGGPVNRIVKYTNLYINPVFRGRGKAPVNRRTRYIGGPVNRGFTVMVILVHHLFAGNVFLVQVNADVFKSKVWHCYITRLFREITSIVNV